MAKRVFITGSTDGLGLAAARSLLDDGHEVVTHARSHQRAAGVRDRLAGAEVLIADLASREQTLELAGQANANGPFDAVIHNAGVGYRERHRIATPEGHAHLLAINVLAPYLLTATMHRPGRLIYTTSGMHRWAGPAHPMTCPWPM
jgi:NAD(P)-dependent dehydrogenase (short-subunit alcohol dehydrogenase family)